MTVGTRTTQRVVRLSDAHNLESCVTVGGAHDSESCATWEAGGLVDSEFGPADATDAAFDAPVRDEHGPVLKSNRSRESKLKTG